MYLFTLFELTFGKLYTIRQNTFPQYALTITDENIGFVKYDPSIEEQKVEINDGEIVRDKRKVCVAPNTPEVRICIAKNPVYSRFEPIEINNLFKLRIRGSQVLSIGDFNENTQMFDAVVLEEKDAQYKGMYIFTIDERPEEYPFDNFKISTNKHL